MLNSSPSHNSSKIRVAVLRGGPSNEYAVSLKTGGALLKHLQSQRMNDRYEPYDVLITRDGIWHMNGFEREPEKIVRNVDVVLNGLHGNFGEDGKVQQILESLGAKYTGSGPLASALAMNKQSTKEIAQGIQKNNNGSFIKINGGSGPRPAEKSNLKSGQKPVGFKTALHLVVRASENTPETVMRIFRSFPHPSIVKPVTSGSSVGVTIAYSISDLERALTEALSHSNTALVEEYIAGREATCGVIDHFRGERLYALPVVEIVPPPAKKSFFDYHAKYSGESAEICPGNFTESERDAIQEAAKQVHDALGLRHYSRADFIVSPRRGIYFLETNTLPGMTNESLFPKALAAVGSDIPDFLDHIIGLALEQN